ncbi:MAG: DEAD/DEAH box helicase, partial [Yaniella sp.]|nr:DEAD/DEAH box helicase [Yaniella sp.]
MQLTDYIPDPDRGEEIEPVLLYDRFVEWTSERGIQLYPAQDEAVTELVDGKNVIMATPTGSGKSMVALAAHFYALAHGQTTYYTAPIKALVSEKFFDLIEIFGAEHVGMV